MDAVYMPRSGLLTVYECPISDCEWSHTAPDPAGYSGEGATTEEWVMNALRAHLEGVESVVREHLETHSLVEWVREVMSLRGQISSSADPSSATERLSFGSADLERYVAVSKRMQEDFAAKVSALLPEGFYVSVGDPPK